jgi:Tetratricopeptide repeat
MDSEQVIARFESERHALALMSHPNVARVLDAGTRRSVARTSSWSTWRAFRSRITATVTRSTPASGCASSSRSVTRCSTRTRSPASGVDLSNLGECLTVMKRYAEAEQVLKEAERRNIATSGENHPRVAKTRRRLAALYKDLGAHLRQLPNANSQRPTPNSQLPAPKYSGTP